LTSSRIADPARNNDADTSNDIPVIFSQPPIVTSRLTPSIYYNTKNASLDPTSGKSLFLGVQLSGGVLGGDVSTFAPQLDFQWFKPVLRRRSEKPHVLAMRFKADHIRAYGSRFNAQRGDTRPLSFINGIPIFERFFIGGEYDIRGYNIRSITPVVVSQEFFSTKGPITARIIDPTTNTLVEAPDGTVDPNLLGNFVLRPPENDCAGVTGPNQRPNCNTQPGGALLQVIGGDTQLIYNVEYRIPIISVLSLAAFADVGTVFNARKYDDQIISSNFVNQSVLPIGSGAIFTLDGGVLFKDGQFALQDDVNRDRNPETGALPDTYKTVFFQGQTQSFQIVRASQSKWRLPEDIRSSFGLEFRVQMPVINVPFRLIMAYNPRIDDPDNFFRERKTVIRFSVGRTF
jgi:outer membrane protein insertion porin family